MLRYAALLLLPLAVQANSTLTWHCVKPDGTRAIQDKPCSETGSQTVRAERMETPPPRYQQPADPLGLNAFNCNAARSSAASARQRSISAIKPRDQAYWLGEARAAEARAKEFCG